MTIIWHGQSCFEIVGGVKIVIDPYSEDIGLRLPKLTADILLSTHNHPDHNNLKAVGGNYFSVTGPGEYEAKGVYIQGIESWHDSSEGKERGQNTVYLIEAEDLRICHLGDFGQKELTPEQVETLGEVDVLMIPVGGVYTISDKEALKVMSQVEPKITIPMHYSIPKLKIKLEGVDKFLKALGAKSVIPQPKLTIKKKDLSTEEAKIVVLEP